MSEKQEATPNLISDQIDGRFFATWITISFLSQRLGLSSAVVEDLDSLLKILSKRKSSDLQDEMIHAINMVKQLLGDSEVESSQESAQERDVT